jgi:hypothetical protein
MRWFLIGLIAASCADAPAVNVVATEDGCGQLFLGDEPETDVTPPFFDSLDQAETCLGNNDGTIEAAEMPTVVGAYVTYSVNGPGQSVAVSTKGATEADGYAWDFTSVPALTPVGIEVEDPADFWFAPHFPDAQYATPVSLWQTDLLGIFAGGPDTVLMLGLASRESPEETAAYTLLVYDEPLAVYRYPLTLGAKWGQTVTFSDAIIQGVKNAGSETYDFVVDGRGTVKLPSFTLANTLRVRLSLSQTFVVSQGKPTIAHTQFFFVHECLGEVARIVSAPDEANKEFTTAAEFRRLGY